MKKFILGITLLVFSFGLFGCAQNKELTIKNTFEQTPLNLIEEYVENSKEVTKTTYLSNTENISFEQAWKASGLSSNSDDYFKIEDAVIVATK